MATVGIATADLTALPASHKTALVQKETELKSDVNSLAVSILQTLAYSIHVSFPSGDQTMHVIYSLSSDLL